MAKAKKKLLPKNFEKMLQEGDIVQLKSVFEACDVNARGGNSKQTAVAFDNCPDELARWLVAEGLDLSIFDCWGKTPLHSRSRSRLSRIDILLELGADVNCIGATASVGTPLHTAASSYHVGNVRLLLSRGAQVDAVGSEGRTPLELALCHCRNNNLEDMAPLAECLLAAGARKTSRMKEYVEEVGKKFEFQRDNYNPDTVDAASAALDRLYELFDVPPVPRRIVHDGRSPITVKGASWQEQHEELWQLLIPGSGAAATVQGEVFEYPVKSHMNLRIWAELTGIRTSKRWRMHSWSTFKKAIRYLRPISRTSPTLLPM